MTTESITPPWDRASAGGDGRSGARSSALRRQSARDQPLWRGPGFGDFQGWGWAVVRPLAVGIGLLSSDGMWCRLRAAYH